MTQQTVVITGASKGIGKAAALLLDKKGFTVFAGVRKDSDGEMLQAAASERLTPLMLDVTKPEQIAAAATLVTEQVGQQGVTALVNNAGIAIATPLEFIPMAELRWQLEVNVIGQMAVTQQFMPLIRQQQGRILNVSSIGGLLANRMTGAYHASKFALEGLTHSLRLELKPWGIEVISIQPGAIATPIWDTAKSYATTLLEKLPPQATEWYRQPIEQAIANAEAAGKEGTPPEVVAEVIYEAITAVKPKPNYLVGGDAKFAARFIRPLPTRLRDRLILSR